MGNMDRMKLKSGEAENNDLFIFLKCQVVEFEKKGDCLATVENVLLGPADVHTNPSQPTSLSHLAPQANHRSGAF